LAQGKPSDIACAIEVITATSEAKESNSPDKRAPRHF
jgi:hypothetical protein